MRAAVFVDEGICEIQDRPLPRMSHPDEVLLAVEACGLCGTDLHILATPPGHPATPGTILGHEFLGRIATSFIRAAGLSENSLNRRSERFI